MKSIMLQGTSSDVGKSVLCAALGRIFYEDGWKVAPFKSQNMALNSYITKDGKEIGRAQGVQAEACGIEATVDMNPILLKPKQDMMAEVIVHGKHFQDFEAGAYREDFVPKCIPMLQQSLDRLAQDYEILVMEGAGSPAEINLKERDIANMKMAHLADAPVLLIADIDRGGVFASLVGTLALLDEDERARVKGFIINKFRGKLELLQPGLEWLEEYTGIPVLGVIPYAQLDVEAEDSLSLANLRLKKQDENPEALRITVISLPRISNFTDLDPLYEEPGVSVYLVSSPDQWKDADIILIPGTKNTTDDLRWLQETGLAGRIQEAASMGTRVVGICGGYQMLGKVLRDPEGIESNYQEMEGLGLLNGETIFQGDKRTVRVEGTVIGGNFAEGQSLEGYEIHLGRTHLAEGTEPLIQLSHDYQDGAISEDGRCWGTYLHGIFHNRNFTRSWLNEVRQEKGVPVVDEAVLTEKERREQAYGALGKIVRENLDMDKIYEIMGLSRK